MDLRTFERAYDRYLDRLHDAYYAEDPPCPECQGYLTVVEANGAANAVCDDCDYSHTIY